MSTDAAILAGLAAEQPGRRSATAAPRPRSCTHSRARAVRTRAASWPPDASGADLVVNATSERDDVLVELTAGPDARRPAVPGDGDRGSRRGRAGATVVSGLEVLVAQGAASFELWTGVAAPVEVMRDAVGLPA